ncbi:MAG: polyhydroxyalkanoic acid system family protein [Deltaproteobacteria bacterium]|nr:polyhydroxyalkanoic acid system family protein [Deltaproteobacteria bacterium]
MTLTETRVHALALGTLRARLDARAAVYIAKYPALDLGARYRWVTERVAEASYNGAGGTLELGEDRVTVTLELPFFAMLYRERIEAFVLRELDALVRADAS